jgi:hypothetical protein
VLISASSLDSLFFSFFLILVNVESFVFFWREKKKTKCSSRGENKQTSLKFFSFSSSQESHGRACWQAQNYAGRNVGPVVDPAVQLPFKKIEILNKMGIGVYIELISGGLTRLS